MKYTTIDIAQETQRKTNRQDIRCLSKSINFFQILIRFKIWISVHYMVFKNIKMDFCFSRLFQLCEQWIAAPAPQDRVVHAEEIRHVCGNIRAGLAFHTKSGSGLFVRPSNKIPVIEARNGRFGPARSLPALIHFKKL